MKANNQTIRKSGNSRRGSALLVVLGMLAFMLFSGLAFSVYMRQSRLPTSFLRRTATTRQLAKAALAEAIDQIDRAIGNDPHPNVRLSGKAFDKDRLDNIWTPLHRVFIGLGKTSKEEGSNDQPANGSIYPAYASPSETVPTLTLEGLAYLPPNLINEARYYSQRTPTAKWHSFWFDSGRYAYTAIDVSDYFDVNRIQADKPRAAIAARRISFAHLFEEGADHASAGSGAAQWDNFMKRFRTVDDETDEITYNTYPFVSMADFNIAWGSQEIGGMKSPFYDFVKSGRPYDCGSAKDDPDAETYRGMTFVTDGYFPKPSRSGDGRVIYCCLEEERYQPFKKNALERKDFKPSVDDVATYAYSDSGMQSWAVTAGGSGGLRINQLNFAALWDYLDVDSVPLSLCIPTVERTPMVCGLRPYVEGDIEIALTQSPKAGETGSDVAAEKSKQIGSDYWDLYSREIAYTLDLSKLRSAFQDVRVLLTYPFNDHGYQCPDVDTTWTLDGRFSAFLTLGGDNIPLRVADNRFKANPKRDAFKNLEITDKSLVSFPLRASGTITAGNFKDKSSDIGLSCALSQLRMDAGAPNASDLVLLKVKYTWPRDRYKKDEKGKPILTEPPTANVNPDPLAGMDGMRVESVSAGSFFPLSTTGQRADANGGWATVTGGKLASATDLKLNFAVWVRLANSGGDAVDFVPACQQDDVNMNKGKTSMCTKNCGGSGYVPLMRVAADGVNGGLQISVANLAKAKPTLGTVKFPDVKWVVADPRYNHAPENWVQTRDGGALQEADWKDDADIQKMVKDGDGDGYMATSDVGYMQSIYELAFLPRVSDGFTDAARGNVISGNLSPTFTGDFAQKHSEAKDNKFMWRTYSPFGRYGTDEFLELENIMIPGDGPKVNPYSDSKKVLMAALANTPHDWRLSADSDDEIFKMKGAEFNKKHAWNNYSTDTTGKMCWDCLEAVAEQLQLRVREDAYAGKWEDAFADLGWSTDPTRILDTTKDGIDDEDGDKGKIYSVDKKFLYGFWNDCFSARQQLFLIFVRAEPMMMGGGVKGQIPPQLGARAVALVWRDPTATTGTRTVDGQTLPNPHRTRILFYHQFD